MLNPDSLEHLMYLVMGAISNMKAPVIFKGYQVLNLILNEKKLHCGKKKNT
jgi:hypothetical protein